MVFDNYKKDGMCGMRNIDEDEEEVRSNKPITMICQVGIE